MIYQIKFNLEMFEMIQQSERRRDSGNGECLLWGIFISAFWISQSFSGTKLLLLIKMSSKLKQIDVRLSVRGQTFSTYWIVRGANGRWERVILSKISHKSTTICSDLVKRRVNFHFNYFFNAQIMKQTYCTYKITSTVHSRIG